MFGEWGYPDNPGLSRIIQILDNPGYVWIYPDNTRLRNGGGGGGRGGGADAEHRIKLPPERFIVEKGALPRLLLLLMFTKFPYCCLLLVLTVTTIRSR